MEQKENLERKITKNSMNEAVTIPTCAGCMLNPYWIPNYVPIPYVFPQTEQIQPVATFFAIPDLSPYQLTEQEQNILFHLGKAYDLFASLEAKHPADAGEFTEAIHRLQEKVMARVARRLHPQIFTDLSKEEKKEKSVPDYEQYRDKYDPA